MKTRQLTALFFAATLTACAAEESVTTPFPRLQNGAPSLQSALIPASHYRTLDTLTVEPVGWRDPDGDPEWYRYQWYVNGSPVQGEIQASLAGDYFEKGDVVHCQVIPVDAFGEGLPVNSNEVSIRNSSPVLTNAVFTAPKVTAADDIVIEPVDAVDADGDPVVFDYVWIVNGTAVTGVTSNRLTSDYFQRGDTIQVSVTPVDGSGGGTPVYTETITVRNALPLVDTAAIAPGPYFERSIISANAFATDADGDSLTYEFLWYRNGVSIPGATGTFLTGTHFDRGDSITFGARAHDGFAFGLWAESNAVDIVNTPPDTPLVEIYPSSVTAGDPLWVEVIDAVDADGDPLTITYEWRVDGAFWRSATDVTAVTYPHTGTDGVWSVVVTANDGFADSATAYVERNLDAVVFVDIGGYYPSDYPYTSEASEYALQHQCALDSRGYLWCWGITPKRRFWDGAAYRYTGDTYRPDLIAKGWEKISKHATCGITSQGEAHCWTDQFAIGNSFFERTVSWGPSAIPGVEVLDMSTPVSPATGWTFFDSSPYHQGTPDPVASSQYYYGVQGDGSLWATRHHPANQYSSSSKVTTDTGFSTVVVAVPASGLPSQHACAIKTDRTLWCWGDSELIGTAISTDAVEYCGADCWYQPTPLQVAVGTTWKDAALGNHSSCGIQENGELWCWGNSYSDGVFAQGTDGLYTWPTPQRVGVKNDWASVVAEGRHYCALDAAGEIWCWGHAAVGQLGYGGQGTHGSGVNKHVVSMVKVQSGEHFVKVRAMVGMVCGLTSSGALYCWGHNYYSTTLGLGDDDMFGPELCGALYCSTIPRRVR